MPNILVAGAASGIGKAFLHAYLERPEHRIFVVDKSFADNYLEDFEPGSRERLSLHSVDITSPNALASQLGEIHDINLVIHSAGIRGLEPSVPVSEGSDMSKAESLSATTPETMHTTYAVNTIGTFNLLRLLLERLASGAKVIIMGSRMGSITSNNDGGGYAYRASKAALNAVVKSFAVDKPKVVFLIIHPGRVDSNIVGIKEERSVTPEEAVKEMMGLIEGWKEGSGRFVDRGGKDIPW
ncbi:hypothetical protein MMC21_006094 [Puttea exsequens]|nr:hypothetical protein [Puttea exsequens]